MSTRVTFFPGNANTVVVDVAQHPTDPEKSYILWSDGKISYRGAGLPSLEATRPTAWEGTGQQPARAIQITDWTLGKGYILAATGLIYPLNGATGGYTDPNTLPWPYILQYDAFYMNPDGSGAGYITSTSGHIWQFGGAAAPSGSDFVFSPAQGRRFFANFSGPSATPYAFMHGNGQVHFRTGAGLGAAETPTYGPVFNFDIARDFVVHDTTGYWSGYILDGYGWIHTFYSTGDSEPAPILNPSIWTPSNDRFRVLRLLDGTDRVAAVTADGWFWDWDVEDPTYTATVAGPTGAQATRKPTISFQASSGTTLTAPDRFQVRMYEDDDYSQTGFSISFPTQYDSGVQSRNMPLTTTQLFALTDMIGNGTWKPYVRVGKVLNDGAVAWSSWAAGPSFSIAGTITTPTLITPAAGATVNTDVPMIGASIQPDSLGAPVKAQWQLATAADFSTDSRYVTEADSDLRTSGGTTERVPNLDQLFQGNWYIRARGMDKWGGTSSWSTGQRFRVSHPPTTANWSPTGDQARPFGIAGSVDLSWDFSDSSPVDSQSAYRVLVQDNATGVTVVDTGKVVTSTESATVTIPVDYKDVELRWRVRVWDSDDVSGPFGPNQLFRMMDDADLVIVGPSAIITSPQPTIEWTFAATGSRTQRAYRVTITHVDGLDTITDYDSGQIQGSVTSYQIPTPVIENGIEYTIALTVWDSNGLATATDATALAAWIPPPAGASVTIDAANFTADGYVSIEWADGTQDEDFKEWRIYRRTPEVSSTWELVDSAVSSPYLDYMAPAVSDVEYAIVQVADRFGVDVVSGFAAHEVTTGASYYWLIYPDDADYNVLLSHVRGEQTNFAEYEEQELVLIGRGRKVDYGTRLGRSGELSGSVRPTETMTTRQQKTKIDQLKELRATMYLRTPFGDVYKVAARNISVTRVPGTGLTEMLDVTIPWTEVI